MSHGNHQRRGLSSDHTKATNPEDLNLLFYDFNRNDKEASLSRDLESQKTENLADNEEGEGYYYFE